MIIKREGKVFTITMEDFHKEYKYIVWLLRALHQIIQPLSTTAYEDYVDPLTLEDRFGQCQDALPLLPLGK